MEIDLFDDCSRESLFTIGKQTLSLLHCLNSKYSLYLVVMFLVVP